MNTAFLVLLCALCGVKSISLKYEGTERTIGADNVDHKIEKRFVNPSLAAEGWSNRILSKIRTKRSSEEECEKLRLCRLHARSNMNFFAAFELYFVNKENARLWDHHGRSLSECSQRYSCYS